MRRVLALGAPPHAEANTLTNTNTAALLRTANLRQPFGEPFDGGAHRAKFQVDNQGQAHRAALADYGSDFGGGHDAPAPSFAARSGSIEDTIFSVSLSGCGVAASAWAMVAWYCA